MTPYADEVEATVAEVIAIFGDDITLERHEPGVFNLATGVRAEAFVESISIKANRLPIEQSRTSAGESFADQHTRAYELATEDLLFTSKNPKSRSQNRDGASRTKAGLAKSSPSPRATPSARPSP